MRGGASLGFGDNAFGIPFGLGERAPCLPIGLGERALALFWSASEDGMRLPGGYCLSDKSAFGTPNGGYHFSFISVEGYGPSLENLAYIGVVMCLRSLS